MWQWLSSFFYPKTKPVLVPLQQPLVLDLNILPDDIVEQILEFLPQQDVYDLSFVSKTNRWSILPKKNRYWSSYLKSVYEPFFHGSLALDKPHFFETLVCKMISQWKQTDLELMQDENSTFCYDNFVQWIKTHNSRVPTFLKEWAEDAQVIKSISSPIPQNKICFLCHDFGEYWGELHYSLQTNKRYNEEERLDTISVIQFEKDIRLPNNKTSKFLIDFSDIVRSDGFVASVAAEIIVVCFSVAHPVQSIFPSMEWNNMQLHCKKLVLLGVDTEIYHDKQRMAAAWHKGRLLNSHSIIQETLLDKKKGLFDKYISHSVVEEETLEAIVL